MIIKKSTVGKLNIAMNMSKTYTVTWNPGTFGHLLIGAIDIEKFGQKPSINENSDSHDVGFVANSNINRVHVYDRKLLNPEHKIIKPYFKNQDLKFFPWLLNEIKYLKSQKHIVEEIRQHWDTVEPICDISFNIDMTELFTNVDSFYKNIARFFETTELKQDTKTFIKNKREINLPLYEKYLKNIVDTVSCLKNKQHKDIQHLENIELAMVLCDFLHLKQFDAVTFCNNYDDKPINSTKDILNYV